MGALTDPDWVCAGQDDLLDLVDTEHIRGSMPADATCRYEAQLAFYQRLRDGRYTGNPWQISERQQS